MNDSPIDVGLQTKLGNSLTPVVGKAIPLIGTHIFLDQALGTASSARRSATATDNDNTDAQAPNAFRMGHYALGNVLYTPVSNATIGTELQWGRRENFSDGFHSDGLKLQFSFKYNFSYKLGQ